MGKPVILLDPGHGGYDPGAVYHGLEEKALNLKLALKLTGMLKGLKVLLTRDRDIFVSLADRVAMSRRVEPNLFLSLHANAGGGHGFESFIYSGLKPASEAGKMQEKLHPEIMAALKPYSIRDRGRKQAAFYVLRHNPQPAVLIESLFIDNAREAGRWENEAFTETLAGGVAEGIYKALGLPPGGSEKSEKEAGRDPVPSGNSLYSVQVGAFRYIENARQRLSEAKDAGFSDAFIYQKKV